MRSGLKRRTQPSNVSGTWTCCCCTEAIDEGTAAGAVAFRRRVAAAFFSSFGGAALDVEGAEVEVEEEEGGVADRGRPRDVSRLKTLSKGTGRPARWQAVWSALILCKTARTR